MSDQNDLAFVLDFPEERYELLEEEARIELVLWLVDQDGAPTARKEQGQDCGVPLAVRKLLLAQGSGLGAIGSVAAMLEYSFGLREEAAAVNSAIEAVLGSGTVTADLKPTGAPATTEQVGKAVCDAIR